MDWKGQSGGRTLWRYGFLCVLVAALLRSSLHDLDHAFAYKAYKRPVLTRAISKSLKKTAGNTLRPGERSFELPSVSPQRRQEVLKLLSYFKKALPMMGAISERQMRKKEYQSHFRPEASSQAWEEMDPMSFAQLLSAEDDIEGFVDVGSGLGKLVMIASSIVPYAPCWGIELSPTRATAAAEGLQGLRKVSAICGSVKLLQGNCLKDLPIEALETASHFLLTMRRVGKLPAGTRQVAERFIDLLQSIPSSRRRVVWSVGKRLEPREGLDHVSASFLRAEWSDAQDVLVHRYSV